MTKKIESIENYVSAHDAAQVLSLKMGRPIRPDYINRLARGKKRSIRTARFRDRIYYHKEDIAGVTIRQRAPKAS